MRLHGLCEAVVRTALFDRTLPSTRCQIDAFYRKSLLETSLVERNCGLRAAPIVWSISIISHANWQILVGFNIVSNYAEGIQLAFWPVIHRLCELLMGILNFKFWTKRYSLDFVCVTQNCVHLSKFVSKRFFPSAFRDSLKNFFNFPAMSFCGEHISLFEFLQVNIGNSTPSTVTSS